jgi:heme-degrading monooxygenase HmoA
MTSQPSSPPTTDRTAPSEFVVTSELRVPSAGADALERAFADRLGEVDGFDGFRRLEVWADEHDEGRYVMVSWWDSRDRFLTYMRSAAHRRSHARVPVGDDGPRPVSVTRYRRIVT